MDMKYFLLFFLLYFINNEDVTIKDTYSDDSWSIPMCSNSKNSLRKNITFIRNEYLEKKGTCYGYAYCTACSTCNYCKYCNNGGRCGVCSSSFRQRPKPSYSYKPSKNTISSNSNNNNYYTTIKLFLKASNSNESRVAIIIPKGSKVKMLNTYFGPDWWQVSYKKVIGYAPKKYFSKNAIKPSEKSSENYFPNSLTSQHIFKVVKRTSLREEPNSKSRIILRFKVGDSVTVINTSGEWWWKVKYRSSEGWIKRRLLLQN